MNNSEKVELTGSEFRVENGDVVANKLTAKTLKLSANQNITLVESQLHATEEIQLLAQDTVQVRDSVEQSFIAQSGGSIKIQGTDKSGCYQSYKANQSRGYRLNNPKQFGYCDQFFNI